MNLVRLARHQHPAPPHRELRKKGVFDSGSRHIGQVENLYVEEDSRRLRFVDVVTSGFMGLGRKHCLVPVEAIKDQALGSITLEVDQRTLESESAPAFFNPQLVPDERLQRATREHYGYG
jgi:sporulation protein YlmC with PRC-barrel domain